MVKDKAILTYGGLLWGTGRALLWGRGRGLRVRSHTVGGAGRKRAKFCSLVRPSSVGRREETAPKLSNGTSLNDLQ